MTNWMTKTMFATAALALAASVASAQSLKAEISFAFQASGKRLAPGTYNVVKENYGATTVYRLVSRENGTNIVVPTVVPHDPPKEWAKRGEPMLAFACSEAGCHLAELWASGGAPAYHIRHPKSQDIRIAYVVLRNQNAD